MQRRNVLIFHAGALGDFVLSWPLALALGRLYPQSRIIYVAAGEKGALAEKVLRVESTDVEEGWHHLFGDAEALPEICRRRLEGAHSIFTYVASVGDVWCNAVRKIAPDAELVCLKTRPAEDFAGHASEHLLAELADKPVVRTAVMQILASIASSGVMPSRPGGEYILIHPGSGSKEKCWPVDKYVELIERLRGDKRLVKVVLGEVENDPAKWALGSWDKMGEVARCGSYLKLLEQLRQARVFIGNDSGPGHLAGIIGVPTILLFGPTRPEMWKPLGPRVTALRGAAKCDASLPTLAVRTVYDSIGAIR